MKADDLHISTRQKAWPKSSSALTRRLRLLRDPLGKIGWSVDFIRGQKRLISIASEAGKVPKKQSKSSTPSNQGPTDDIDDVDGPSESFPTIALGALRKIIGPFTDDYAIERIMETGLGCAEAEAWVNLLINEGLLARDPEGYLRLVK